MQYMKATSGNTMRTQSRKPSLNNQSEQGTTNLKQPVSTRNNQSEQPLGKQRGTSSLTVFGTLPGSAPEGTFPTEPPARQTSEESLKQALPGEPWDMVFIARPFKTPSRILPSKV